MFFLKELPTEAMLARYHDRFPAMDTTAVGDALGLLRRASLLMRELDAYFARHGVSQTRFLAMIVIDREKDDDGLLPSEIAARLDVSRPVVTDLIRGLTAGDLLDSKRATGDGRAKRLSLTPAGRAMLDGVLPGYFALIAAFMARDDMAWGGE